MIEPSPRTKRFIERNRKRNLIPTPEQESQRLEEMEKEEGEVLSAYERWEKKGDE